MEPTSLIVACIEFFGLRSGQSRMDFMRDEYRKLTPEDQQEIKAGLEAQGYSIKPIA